MTRFPEFGPGSETALAAVSSDPRLTFLPQCRLASCCTMIRRGKGQYRAYTSMPDRLGGVMSRRPSSRSLMRLSGPMLAIVSVRI